MSLKAISNKPANQQLRVATIFSTVGNDDNDLAKEQISIEQEPNDFDVEALSNSDKAFLNQAIADYNVMFNTDHDISNSKS